MPNRLGVDVGGTHIDFLLFDDTSGRTHVHKTPATPDDPVAGLARGLNELVRAAGIRPADIVELVHATNVPDASLRACASAKVGLLVTRGFEQVLHLGRSRVVAPLQVAAPDASAPLADLAMTRGVAERMSAHGDAITPLDEGLARQAIGELLSAGAQSLTVCLLHAYANPAHELQVKAIIRDLDAQIPVTLSHEVTQEAGEYERALAAVVNATVQPSMHRYVNGLQAALQHGQFSPRIGIAQSTGARAGIGQAVEMPAHTIMAGPAGGAVGAAHVASMAGYSDALALDMGGTSTYICLIRDGAARLSSQTALRPSAPVDAINLPSVDVRCIGAGGAIAAQAGGPGVLRVAMFGAPAGTGPVATPTVTQANVVLGRFANPPASLDVRAAQDAVASLARELGLDVHRTAEGIIEIANENMAGALRRAALEKGLDPTRLALVALGGAGPMHACGLSALSGCTPIVVPRHAGVLATLGFLCSDYSRQFAQTVGRRLDELDPAAINSIIEQLAARGSAWLSSEANARDGKIRYRADVGYARTTFRISASVEPDALVNGGLQALAGQLEQAHHQRFGFKRDEPMQLISLRAIAGASGERLALPKFPRAGADPAHARLRQMQTYFDGTFLNTSVYERDRLAAGNRIVGPAIVVQTDATTVIHPDHVAEVDEYLNLLIRPQGAHD